MSVVVGSRLGHYEIRSQLGAGGMGEVYLAQDINLDRPVAIKVLRSEFTQDERRVRRFQQEARAASALNHPNILTIHEIGTQNSNYFIASEYIAGWTLRDYTAGTEIKTTEVVDVATQVASALAAAHAAGVVHRDIKPENIMLRRDHIVKVLDFGLAKLTERDIADTDAPTLLNTDEGVVMGTARYMSPEQVRGVGVDARTDVWSLAVVIHEMLMGRVPFAGDTSNEVMAAVLEREPQPLLSRGEEIPFELKRIVSKALRKDCEERYQTIRDMLVDLKNLKQELIFDAMKRSTRSQQGVEATKTSNELITAKQKTSAHSLSPYLGSVVKSLKLGGAIAGVIFLAFAAIAYFYFRHNWAPNPATGRAAINSIAVLPFVNASNNREAEYLSDGISESLINSLSQLPQLKVIARSSSFQFRGKEMNPQEVAKTLGVEAILTGRVIQLGDQLHISAELVDTRDGTNVWGEHYNRKAADVLAIQSDISREISEKLRFKLTGDQRMRLTKRPTENTQAYQLYIQGRYYWNQRKTESLNKAIEYFNQAINVDRKYALAYAGLADCYVLLIDYDETAPKDSSQKAKNATLTALEIDDTLAEARTSLAFVKERYDWDFIGAEEEYKRAIELNPNYATAHQWYAEYLSSMGRHAEAIAENERAHELDPLALSINVALGARYHLARKYDDAVRQLLTTVGMYPNFSRARFRLGLTYLQKKMYPEAIAQLQKSVEISGRDTMSVAALAYAFGMSGQKAEALKLLDELKQRSRREYVSPYYMAFVNVGLGERDQALALLEKAYQDRDYRLRLLKAEPVWDSLRADPRFQDIQHRVGLP